VNNKTIAIIGAPSTGKTLLCTQITNLTNWRLVQESDQMPEYVIQDLNSNPESLRTQVWFRNQRLNSFANIKQIEKETIILDTFWLCCKVFAEFMVDKFEKSLFLQMIDLDCTFMPWPDIIIGLTCSENLIYKYFNHRKAKYEQADFSFKRVCKINEGYKKLYHEYNRIHVLDREDLDFKNIENVKQIIEQIILL
jgi:deoxyadenosine/deoxycytidine kinase